MPLIEELIKADKEFKQKIKIYKYPFDVAKCGMENFLTDPKSVHSLAYFYNYALSKCNFKYVMKWDGDMILPKSMVPSFKSFIFSLKVYDEPVLGRSKGLTVYKGFDEKYYYRKNAFEEEIRVFNNVISNYFEKDILWERLRSDIKTKSINSMENIFIEFKDVSTNEFSHWNSGDFGMGMRKRREMEDFKIISELTSENNSEKAIKIEEYGFRIIDYEDIFNF